MPRPNRSPGSPSVRPPPGCETSDARITSAGNKTGRSRILHATSHFPRMLIAVLAPGKRPAAGRRRDPHRRHDPPRAGVRAQEKGRGSLGLPRPCGESNLSSACERGRTLRNRRGSGRDGHVPFERIRAYALGLAPPTECGDRSNVVAKSFGRGHGETTRPLRGRRISVTTGAATTGRSSMADRRVEPDFRRRRPTPPQLQPIELPQLWQR